MFKAQIKQKQNISLLIFNDFRIFCVGVNFFSVIIPYGSEGDDFYCSVKPGPEEPINAGRAQWCGSSIPVVGTKFGHNVEVFPSAGWLGQLQPEAIDILHLEAGDMFLEASDTSTL